MAIQLLRHPKVIKSWQNKCYGQSDIGISRIGMQDFHNRFDELCALKPDIIIHSGLKRTAIIATIIASKTNSKIIAEPLWRERNFGDWEGQSWQQIYRETGNAMDGFLTHPETFAPPNGETTNQLVMRTKTALQLLEPNLNTLIIAHGGTISCALMLQAGKNINDLPLLIPKTLELCTFGKHEIKN